VSLSRVRISSEYHCQLELLASFIAVASKLDKLGIFPNPGTGATPRAAIVTTLIDQAIEVLDDIWAHRPNLWKLRREAVVRVAERRRVHPNTVADKLSPRRLATHSIFEFDRLVGKWLAGDGSQLRQVLLQHAYSTADKAKVEQLFKRRA